jgi:hypothetical protein
MRYAVVMLLALAGCAKRESVVTVVFKAPECISIPTEELRERRIRTTCAMRHGSMNPSNPTKICLSWNHKDITERRTVLECKRDEWVRSGE